MKEFKLSNLRELSTEEQLRLSGGTNPESCNCGSSFGCSCTMLDKQSTDAIKLEVKQKTKTQESKKQ